MRRKLLTALLTLVCSGAFAIKTVPIKGSIISPTDKFIQYTGRISFANPERPAWNFPGIQKLPWYSNHCVVRGHLVAYDSQTP